MDTSASPNRPEVNLWLLDGRFRPFRMRPHNDDERHYMPGTDEEDYQDDFGYISGQLVRRGEIALTMKGIAHARAGEILSAAELGDPVRCMEVMGRGYILIPDYLYILYLARHAFNRGPRHRTKVMMIRLHQPIAARAHIEDSGWAFEDVKVSEVQQFLTPEDAKCLQLEFGIWDRDQVTREVTVKNDIITSAIADDPDAVSKRDAKTSARKKLKAAVPADQAEPERMAVIEYWCGVAGCSVSTPQQVEQLRELMCGYAPDSIRSAMDKAVMAYRSRPASESFEKIASFLTIAEQMIEDAEAEHIHMLKGAVMNYGGAFIPEQEALVLLRAASYLGVALAPLAKKLAGAGRSFVSPGSLENEIRRKSWQGELVLPPESSGAWVRKSSDLDRKLYHVHDVLRRSAAHQALV